MISIGLAHKHEKAYVVASQDAVNELNASYHHEPNHKGVEQHRPRWGVLKISIPYMYNDLLRRRSGRE